MTTNEDSNRSDGSSSLLVDVDVRFVCDVSFPPLRDASWPILLRRSDHLNMSSDEHCEEDDLDLSSCFPSFSTKEHSTSISSSSSSSSRSSLPLPVDSETRLEHETRSSPISSPMLLSCTHQDSDLEGNDQKDPNDFLSATDHLEKLVRVHRFVHW